MTKLSPVRAKIDYEKKLWSEGAKYIVGLDEVGRGPLAGPLVVCAAILDSNKVLKALENSTPMQRGENGDSTPKVLSNLKNSSTRNYDVLSVDNFYTQITDSKLISPKKRDNINDLLINEAIDYSIVEFSNEEIDKVGLGQLTTYAFYSALKNLKIQFDHVLTDAFPIRQIKSEKQTNIIRGDSLSITVGAASIMAKVYRDNIMVQMHTKYPRYGFDKHKGYGTREHIAALQKYGPCEIHRKSYEPVKSLNVKY
jgi:ribonuclease HII